MGDYDDIIAQTDKQLGKQAGTGKPGNYDAQIDALADKHGIDRGMAHRWIQAESGGNPRAVSKAGAKGLTQLLDSTAQSVGVKDSFDPQQNLEGGFKYLKSKLDEFGGDPAKAFAAYNAGDTRVRSGRPLPQETQNYVSKIVGSSKTTGKSDYADIIAMTDNQMTQPTARFRTQRIIDYMNNSFDHGLGPAQMKIIHPDFARGAIDNAHADWLKQKQAKHQAVRDSPFQQAVAMLKASAENTPYTDPSTGAIDYARKAADVRAKQPQQTFIGPAEGSPGNYYSPKPMGVFTAARGKDILQKSAQVVPGAASEALRGIADPIIDFIGKAATDTGQVGTMAGDTREAVDNFVGSVGALSSYFIPVLGQAAGAVSLVSMAASPMDAIYGLLEPWKDPVQTVREGKGLDLLTLPIILHGALHGAGGGEAGSADPTASLHEVVDNIADNHAFTPEEQAQLHTTLDDAINAEATQQPQEAPVAAEPTPEPSAPATAHVTRESISAKLDTADEWGVTLGHTPEGYLLDASPARGGGWVVSVSKNTRSDGSGSYAVIPGTESHLPTKEAVIDYVLDLSSKPSAPADAPESQAGAEYEGSVKPTATNTKPNDVQLAVARHKGQPVLDLHENPTGWVMIKGEGNGPNSNLVQLVHPTEDIVHTFASDLPKGHGYAGIQAAQKAQSFAIDNPIEKVPVPTSGELVVKPIYTSSSPQTGGGAKGLSNETKTTIPVSSDILENRPVENGPGDEKNYEDELAKQPGESVAEWWQRFSRIRAQIPEASRVNYVQPFEVKRGEWTHEHAMTYGPMSGKDILAAGDKYGRDAGHYVAVKTAQDAGIPVSTDVLKSFGIDAGGSPAPAAEPPKLELTGRRTAKQVESIVADADGDTVQEKFKNHYKENALHDFKESMNEYFDRIRCGGLVE